MADGTSGAEDGREAIVVTGAASGIGRATVAQLLERPTVIVVGVDVASQPADLGSDRVVWVTGDVADDATWSEVRAASDEIDPRGPSALISCAADIVIKAFLDTTIDDWRRLFEINVFGTIRGMQALLPAMITRGRGAMAVVCSVNSLFVSDHASAYSTSKAALLHAVRSAALEAARHGVRINAVCPGDVDTPLLQRAFESSGDAGAARAATERRSPTGKILRPEEVASVLCFLISQQASGLSGAAVVVDAGVTTAYDFDSTPST